VQADPFEIATASFSASITLSESSPVSTGFVFNWLCVVAEVDPSLLAALRDGEFRHRARAVLISQ